MDILEELRAENERLKLHNQELSKQCKHAEEQLKNATDWIQEFDKRNAALRQENADLWEYIKESKKLAEETRQWNL